MKEIEVIVDTNGNVSMDVLGGFKGKECEHVLDEISQSLGKKIESKKKAEYWQPTSNRSIKQKTTH